MSQPPLDNQRQEPRAHVYGRGNQAAGRYRSPIPRPPSAPPTTPPAVVPNSRTAVNRRRFWLLTLLLVLTLGIGAATLSAVFADQTPPATALSPDDAVPARVEPPAPPTPRPPSRSTPPEPARQAPVDSEDREPVPAPSTRVAPTGQPGVSPTLRPVPTEGVTYKNCNQARRAGVTPLRTGDPGYSAKLDKDGDGVACDNKKD
ncbi:excalibur calcium-binding domain-containing protein [Micromonospora sp. NPDC050397]|uniref:excalibur calcium-binding domain-containing protein n=1 Tax=Micromonospora sp. NPDC050397 TaxID=3364279 RepID=UPI00384B46FF